jgi:tRNA 2-thiouridine synthesizing protein A
MSMIDLDTIGLRCPQPVLKITALMPKLRPGDIVKISGDCPTFEGDLRKWAERLRKTVLAVTRDGEKITMQIQF